MTISHDILLDLTGMESPIPVIKTKETLDSMSVGQVLCLMTDSESASKNIRTLIINNPYELIRLSTRKEVSTFIIRKNG